MSHEIIPLKNIIPVEKPKLEAEFSRRLEICNLLDCLRSNIPLEETLVDIKGFKVRLCHRKDTDKIWVIQEPNCKYYKPFLDHRKYKENHDCGFGLCDNMRDQRHREMYGCPLSKKYGTFIRVNHPDETYMLAKII